MIPATYNVSYYSGDTLSFIVAPKNQDGTAVDLDGQIPHFVIADERGPTPSEILEATASITVDNTIECTLTSARGALLTGGQTYVYDVDVRMDGSRQTYLTGNFVVLLDVADSE